MFLTPEDMAHLTGYQRPSAQAKWLMRNGVAHYLDAKGHAFLCE